MSFDVRETRGRGATELTVYGRRAVADALDAPRIEVEWVMVSRDTPGSFRDALHARCAGEGIGYRGATAREVHEVSGDPRHDGGVAARVRLGNVVDEEAYLDTLKGPGARTPARVIALDGVTNPQNVGMVVRSAAGAGFGAVLWAAEGTPWISGLTIKASASAVFRATIVRCRTLASGIDALRAGGFTVYGLFGGAGEDLFGASFAHRSLFVLGSETEGISREIGERVDGRLRIPMAGGVESLNVAVAAGVVCFAASRGGGSG